jgi:Co/Zn/Cd efflux system component
MNQDLLSQNPVSVSWVQKPFQRVPKALDINAFKRAALAYPKVLSIYDIHSWVVDGEVPMLTRT